MSNLASLLGGGGGGRSRQAAGTGRTRPTPPAESATPAPAVVPVPAPAPGGAGQISATPIQLSDLQSILSNISVPAGAEAGAGGGAGPAVDLSSGLTGDALQPLLQNPVSQHLSFNNYTLKIINLKEFLDRVKEFLPAGEDGKEVTAADLSGTVQSPQFQQSVSMFSMALSSGQLGPLVREFGLGEEAAAAAAQGDMEAFVKALQKKEGGDKKDKEEDMALD